MTASAWETCGIWILTSATALIVPGPAKWMGCMGREFELFIPWCKIVKIGPDIILVDIDEKEAKHKVK